MGALPALLGALGGVALGFGLLSLLMALFQPLIPMSWVLGNLAVGAVLLGASAVSGLDALRERLRSGASRRRGAEGLNAILRAVVSLAIIGMLAFLSTRYTQRFDWTEQRVNTLSAQTLELLARLEGDVRLTAFFQERDSLAVRDLLARYAAASERLTVEFVDPNVRPDLIEAYGLEGSELTRGLIVASRRAGGESEGPAAADAVRIEQASEFDVTNALARLSAGGRRKVYFLTGHNERRVEASAAADEPAGEEQETPEGRGGLARAVTALRGQSIDVAPLLLATALDVPEDADAVVIAGPTRPFFDEEIESLERYLAGGGGVVVLIDPRARTNIDERVRGWGAALGDDVVVDPVLSLNRQPTAPLAGAYAEGHPIVRSLGRTVFPMARSVTAGTTSGLSPVVFTGDNAWAERDIDGWVRTGRAELSDEDERGPVALLVAGTPTAVGDGAGRLVVAGDSSFATNEFFEVLANRDLLLNAVSWVVGDDAKIAVRPHVARPSTVALTAGEFQAIQYLSLFVLPEGIALVGVLAWWARRRRASA